jgi:hypothetical protein
MFLKSLMSMMFAFTSYRDEWQLLDIAIILITQYLYEYNKMILVIFCLIVNQKSTWRGFLILNLALYYQYNNNMLYWIYYIILFIVN